jgi:acetyltransferase-like isoleucine patch superfamily enzyme
LYRVRRGNVLESASELTGDILIDGDNCRVRIGAEARISASIFIHSTVSNAIIEIGDNCVLNGVIRLVGGDGGMVRIGERTTFNDVGITMHEAGAVTFGRDCMLSTDVHMDPSDMHPIFDRTTGKRLNPPQDIEIGDHVWLANRVLLLKGARVGSGTVVGAGAMVVGTLPPNVLAAGSPAKVVRENIVWTRDLHQQPELEPAPEPTRRRWRWGRN